MNSGRRKKKRRPSAPLTVGWLQAEVLAARLTLPAPIDREQDTQQVQVEVAQTHAGPSVIDRVNKGNPFAHWYKSIARGI